jgi:hypothetical protein|tara:strand:- start:5112 stop:5891 length:780 start_codon:yes stop_codon:yes gene_type:complete
MATAVAKKKAAEVAVMDENMFAADAGMGVNDLGSEDLAIPFIKVLQKMSDELDDLEDAKAGDIYNTVTKEVVKGKDGVRLINCAYNLQYIEWEPRGTGTGAPHAIYGAGDEIPATERGDDNKDYVAGGSGRYLERTAQHYVLVVDEDGMTQQALLPMKSTQFKKSKQWNSAMRSLKMKDSKGGLFTPPRFSHIWKLETVSEENKNGSWHGWQISKDDVVKDPSVYAEAKLFAESIQAGQVNVKHVREEDKETSDEDIPF